MKNRQRRLQVFFLLAAAMIAILLATRLGLARPLTTVLIAPLQPIARWLTGSTLIVSESAEGDPNIETLRQRNRELEAAIASLQVEIVRLREIEQDYLRLSGLLDYATSHAEQELVTADVIAYDTSGYLRWIIINRGTRSGIQIGAPVISELGLVGRVEEVTATAAWVRLIIDQGSAVNARLQETRAEGTVIGQLGGNLRMQFIPQGALVEQGALVVTSGLGGNFPAGIVIGQVTSVRQQEAELFQEAEIRPTVDFDRLELASVIISFEPTDMTIFETEEAP